MDILFWFHCVLIRHEQICVPYNQINYLLKPEHLWNVISPSTYWIMNLLHQYGGIPLNVTEWFQ